MLTKELEIIRLSLGQRLTDLVKKGTADVDLSGHFASGAKVDRTFLIQNMGTLLFLNLPSGDISAINRSIVSDRPLKKFRKLNISGFFVCDQCGQHVEMETNGVKWRAINPCPIPNGIGPIELKINVPSGNIVLGSDFREFFRVMGGHNYDANYLYAKVRASIRYADVGLIFLFVGDLHPELFQCGNNGKFVIGTSGVGYRSPVLVADQVTTISLNEPWYSIVDCEEFVRRTGRNPGTAETVISVRPGVYAVTHQQHLVDSALYLPKTLTEISWVREPDLPVRVFLTEFKALNYTTEQVVGDLLFKNPGWDLYKAVDALICGHADVHPNGWACTEPELTANHGVERIPPLNKKYNWTKLYSESTVVRAARIGEGRTSRDSHIFLNSSFLALSLNVLECILKQGCGESALSITNEREQQNIKLAKRCKDSLAKT